MIVARGQSPMQPPDKLIHERARLLVLTYLASAERDASPFTDIQKELEFTPGNLSIQLRKLEAAGYVEITKEFKENKPLTTIAITAKGSRALDAYLADMESIIRRIKKTR